MGAARIYADYQERLKVLNAVDFGDLLLETSACSRATRRSGRVSRAASATCWSTSTRTATSRSICGCGCWRKGSDRAKANVCVVGDDDQSIYGWRGAEVDNILRFDKDFPGAKVIRLERNYRSTAHILGPPRTSSPTMKAGSARRCSPIDPKPDDEKVNVTPVGREEEARAVGERSSSSAQGPALLNDMAILVRASFQMREFEDRFITLGLNYRVIGGPRFYERLEIRDAMAYLRVVANPADDLAFERIVNVPKRGIGDTTIAQPTTRPRALGVPMLEAAASWPRPTN
jgi:DNA helicase-2/ATP-dependent DNA helicase PcrA